ncbi:VVA0879 family protein [Aromatoleum sp.]|jgi:hypothetical protein|uniref:VVA0879 family protein n=1 Tax=Aromatoleum sp. TaxID=2307007 RepID=UPI0039173A10
MRTLSHQEWLAEAKAKFGDDPLTWRFVCPSCGHVASIRDWRDAGAPEGAMAFSCIGRYTGDANAAANAAFRNAGGPCNYTGGGLFRLNPVTVTFAEGEPRETFEFAEAPHDA